MDGGSLQTQLALLSSATRGELVVGRPRNRARKQLLIGGILVVATFFGIGLWAAVTPIGSAAIAPGAVTIDAGRQVVQHLEEGIVKEILVRDGDHVEKGDVLLRMDGTRARAELELIRSQIDLAEASVARLVAEQSNSKSIDFPAALKLRSANPYVAGLIADQEQIFKARAEVLDGQKSILNQQIAQYQQQIAGFRAVQNSKKGQLELINLELADQSWLLAKGLTSKSKVLALRREAEQLDGDRGQAGAEMARAEQGIGESTRQIYQLDKQRQDENSKELLQVQQQLNELRQKLAAAADVVNRLDVVAPMTGTVFNASVRTVGAVISPNTTLMEIIPEQDRMLVEAELDPMDVDSIRVGGQVSIRVVAANSRLTPVIYGRLDRLSADRMASSSPGAPGRPFFKAQISVPRSEIDRLQDVKLHIGMPVEIFVSRGSQTVLHYILKPLLDSLARSFKEI